MAIELEALKAQARRDKDAALDEVSHQFESLFLQMMLKSMRKASFGGGLLDSRNTEFYRDMYDQQLAMDLSKQEGIGLAGVIKRQIGYRRYPRQRCRRGNRKRCCRRPCPLWMRHRWAHWMVRLKVLSTPCGQPRRRPLTSWRCNPRRCWRSRPWRLAGAGM